MRVFHCRPLWIVENAWTPFVSKFISQGIPSGPVPEQTTPVCANSTCATVCGWFNPVSAGVYFVRRDVEILLGKFVFMKVVKSAVSAVLENASEFVDRTWSQLNWKNVLPFLIGAPKEPPNSLRRKGLIMCPVMGLGVFWLKFREVSLLSP